MALDLDGAPVFIPPGSAVCGVGFRAVQVDYEDMLQPEWVMSILSTRLAPETDT